MREEAPGSGRSPLVSEVAQDSQAKAPLVVFADQEPSASVHVELTVLKRIAEVERLDAS
jgi:hypothetical protein